MTTAHNAPTITFIICRWFGSIEILRFTQDDGSLSMLGRGRAGRKNQLN